MGWNRNMFSSCRSSTICAQMRLAFVTRPFVLRAIALMSGGVAVLSLLATFGAWARQLLSHIAR